MFHIVYKVTHESGKYYIGRHSTKNINDNYIGSGRWIKSIKDKSTIKKEILHNCNSFEELLLKEEQEIQLNIENINCMNWSNTSCGFATGKYNPKQTGCVGKSHTNETKQKISANRKNKNTGDSNWMYGKKALEQNKKASSETNSELYEIIYPNGTKTIIKNMSKFCKENGLSAIVFYRYHNKNKPYKGLVFKRL